MQDLPLLRRGKRRGQTRGRQPKDRAREVQQKPGVDGGVRERVRGGGEAQRPAQGELGEGSGRPQPHPRGVDPLEDLADGLRAAGRSRPTGAPHPHPPAGPARVHPPQRGDGRTGWEQRGRHHHEAHTDHRGEQRAEAGAREGPRDQQPDGELGFSADPVRDVHQLRASGSVRAVPGPG